MRIAPVSKLWIFAEVFIANIMSANPCHPAVHDNHLAVITKVDLESVARSFLCVEIFDFDSGLAEFIFILNGKIVTPGLVVQKVNLHPLFRFSNQVFFDLSTDLVVVDNKELKKNVLFRNIDPI